MRHLHASEVALANGLDPFFPGLQHKSPKLALAAVGQLASPFQGAWVLANAMINMNQAGTLPGPVWDHLGVLQTHAKHSLMQRDVLLKVDRYTESMQRLAEAIELWGNPEADLILKTFRVSQSQLPQPEQIQAVLDLPRCLQPTAGYPNHLVCRSLGNCALNCRMKQPTSSGLQHLRIRSSCSQMDLAWHPTAPGVA